MKTRQAANCRPSGLSLLEMMVATAMMATLMTSVVVVMRSGYSVWNAQEADVDLFENGYGVLRHFVQQMRQATSIDTISDPTDATGNLSFLSAAGTTRSWSHNGAPKEVHFNNGTGSGLLAQNIESLTFTAYKADGITQTTNVAEIQVVSCAVQIILASGMRTISCRACIRSW
jgi:hypothetical protein